MVYEDLEQIIKAIHNTPQKMVIEFAGAGSQALFWLHRVGGSSRTILEATDRYASASLIQLIGFEPETFTSRSAAVAMAARAYQRAGELNQSDSSLAGVSCTAAIATDRLKRGEHRCYVATYTPQALTTYTVTLAKGRRNRAEEETAVSLLLLTAIANVCQLESLPDLPLQDEETVKKNVQSLDPLHRLLNREIDTARITPDGTLSAGESLSELAILSGSFNPLHRGHRQMAELAGKRLNREIYFELPLINADKATIGPAEACRRAAQFADFAPVVFTGAPLFSQKAALFPNSVFIIGVDTAARLLEPRFYEDDPAQMERAFERIKTAGCRFLVFGRQAGDRFLTLADLSLPADYQDLFEGFSEEEFRVDESSTAIRQTLS